MAIRASVMIIADNTLKSNNLGAQYRSMLGLKWLEN
jgi:hypothetical protein